MTIGEIIRLAIEWLYSLWPWRIVHAWESGVRVWLGNPVKLLGYGLHWYIPLLGSLEIIPTNTMTVETELQTHTVGDETVTFTLGLKYNTCNARLLFLRTHETEATLTNEVLRIAGKVIEELETDRENGWGLVDTVRNDLPHKVWEQASAVFTEWGVEIEELGLITCCAAPAHRVLADGW